MVHARIRDEFATKLARLDGWANVRDPMIKVIVRIASVALVLFLGIHICAPTRGRAQNPSAPQFTFEKPADKPTEWKVQSKGGLLITSGNSRSETGTLALDGSRLAGGNKLSFNGAVAYGRSSVLNPVVVAGVATDTTRDTRTTTNEWKSRARYDRFFTPNNAVYVLGQLGADKIAGKRLYGGGQVGYSRQLYKSDAHTTVGEVGYDFSYESYVQPAGKTLDAVAIHSARLFVGELFSLSRETGITAGLEALFNLNKEQALDAADATGGTKGVGAFKDTRLIGKAGLTTVLHKSLSFGFGFTVKYDQNPAPRSFPGVTLVPLFQPFADKVDTLTEASLLYTFL